MHRIQAIDALKAVGDQLRRAGESDPVTVILGGAVAAIVVAQLPLSRVTHDCDVVASEPDEGWQAVQQAARQVAEQRHLPADWLNRDLRMYAHLLPLGWRTRCESVGKFGPMTVLVIGRRDLLAMKLMGAAARPQDMEDILAIKPSTQEIVFLRQHLDRLEAESLSRSTYDMQRTLLDELEPNRDRT